MAEFFDSSDTFKREQQRIARRRQQALEQVARATTIDPSARGEMVGPVRTVGNQLGSIVQGITAPFLQDRANEAADQELADLDTKFKTEYEAWMAEKPDDLARTGDPAGFERWVQRGQQFGKRADLELAFANQADTRRFRSDEAEATREARASEAEANRIARAEEKELDRQARKDLRAMPSQHITIRGGGRDDGGATVPNYRPPAGYRWTPTGELEAITGGPADKPAPLTKMTAAQSKALDDSDLFLQHIDNALGLLQQNPDALGMKTMIPDVALQRIYPEGVATRAAVGGLSAEKVHQLSGAAVSPAEFARLRPYLPSAGDDTTTATKKLEGLRAEAQRIRDRHAGQGQQQAPGTQVPTVVRTGTHNGRKVQQMSDGTVRYVN